MTECKKNYALLSMTLKQKIETIYICNYSKIAYIQNAINKSQRQDILRKIFAMHMTDKKLIFLIYPLAR